MLLRKCGSNPGRWKFCDDGKFQEGLSFPCGEELLDYGAPDGARHYSHGRDNLCWTGNTEQWYLTQTSLLLFLRFLEGECPEFAIAVMLLVWIVFTH